MSNPLRNEAREWLRKALSDLGSARKLSEQPEPYLDTAIYHCQQSAEKAIKAFLTFHQTRFERTHDLEVLISLAAAIDSGFSAWVTTGQMLTPYAAIYRYPGEMGKPDQTEFDEAFEMASGFLGFVLSVLPQDLHPQKP